MITVTTGCKCPYCEATVNRASSTNGEHVPMKDDLTLCAKCGGLSVFRADLTLKKADAGLQQEYAEPIRIAKAAIIAETYKTRQ